MQMRGESTNGGVRADALEERNVTCTGYWHPHINWNGESPEAPRVSLASGFLEDLVI